MANTAQVLYLPLHTTMSAVFKYAALVYSAFTDLLVLRGRMIINAFSRFSKQL